jgi:hypothetical protein
MVPFAFGTQTGGSTIRPAAFCSIVGYKPTFNTINRAGLMIVAESLDQQRLDCGVKLGLDTHGGMVAVFMPARCRTCGTHSVE